MKRRRKRNHGWGSTWEPCPSRAQTDVGMLTEAGRWHPRWSRRAAPAKHRLRKSALDRRKWLKKSPASSSTSLGVMVTSLLKQESFYHRLTSSKALHQGGGFRVWVIGSGLFRDRFSALTPRPVKTNFVYRAMISQYKPHPRLHAQIVRQVHQFQHNTCFK